MSGPFGSSQWMYSSGAAGFYDTEIDGSLRFNDDDSAYLTRTPSTAGNRRTWTWSSWVKRSRSDSDQILLALYLNGGSDQTMIRLRSGGALQFGHWNGSGYDFDLRTSALLRDFSAWYHIVCVLNTTSATSSYRASIYINGEKVSAFSTESYPSQNYEADVNSTNVHGIGRFPSGVSYYDGYMAEINFVDGQALNPTSFGETKSGVWIPKAYSGSYGTNGFHLEFAGNTNDSSGNGNNWTANNISSYDYVPDSPTNNFSTLNPLGTNDISTFSQGNLQITTGSGASTSGATMGMSSGKWYAEFVCTAKTSVNFGFGLIKANTFDGDNQLDEGNNVGYFWVNNATVYHGFASDSYGATVSTGDVVGIAFDADTLALQWYKNGVGQGNYTRVASENTAGDHWIFGCGEGQGGATATFVANFGQDSSFVGNKTAQGNSDENGYGDFYYTPPSGYLALCTANLTVAEAVDPALDNSPADYFGTALYTGASNLTVDTGLPSVDMVWIKGRSTGNFHRTIDKVRGNNIGVYPNTNVAESSYSANDDCELDTPSSGNIYLDVTNGGTNQSGATHVAWCWRAGGAGSANSEGSVTTTSTSANTNAGFSIITWTGDGTLGHGLDQAPEMFIVKIRNTAGSWWVWHKDLSNTSAGYLQLNSTNGEGSNTSVWRNSYPATATTIDVNTSYLNYSTDNYLAYCFHSVEGLSSFGKYVGNGSTDGPFVYTGFRPAFVITKPINTASSWCMHDSARTPANTGTMGYFKANTADTELFNRFDMDLLSNGFKIKSSDADVNHSGGKVIYMAFAENPFKYANAR